MPYLDVYACIMLTHVQACLLSDVITSVNRRPVSITQRNKIRKSALEHLEGEGTFKSQALWSVREGKGLRLWFSVVYNKKVSFHLGSFNSKT